MASTKVNLSTGRDVEIDLYKMTIREWRAAYTASEEENDALIARCCGLTLDEVESLPFPDHVKLVRAFLEAAKNPLSDPN